MKGWVKAIETPKMYIWPVVILLCIIGAYSINNSMNDVLVMLLTAVLAFFGEKYGFSKIPLMMGLVLSPIMEDSMRNALLIDAPQAFFTKPISVALVAITIATAIALFWLLKPRKDTSET
jgi:putative tricarboxylic transport membrane protein